MFVCIFVQVAYLPDLGPLCLGSLQENGIVVCLFAGVIGVCFLISDLVRFLGTFHTRAYVRNHIVGRTMQNLVRLVRGATRGPFLCGRMAYWQRLYHTAAAGYAVRTEQIRRRRDSINELEIIRLC